MDALSEGIASIDIVSGDFTAQEVINLSFIDRTERTIAMIQSFLGYKISQNAVTNMYQLFEGNLQLPWILLQNPTHTHDCSNYGQMVESTFTLSWIRSKLQNIGMRLEDMPVLDVFPLVTNPELEALPLHKREAVTSLSFSITEDFIRTFRPRRAISMQCHSRSSQFADYTKVRGHFRNDRASQLASSVAAATNSQMCTRNFDGVVFDVVMSRHPAGLGRSRNVTRGMVDQVRIMERMLEQEYGTYAQRAASWRHARPASEGSTLSECNEVSLWARQNPPPSSMVAPRAALPVRAAPAPAVAVTVASAPASISASAVRQDVASLIARDRSPTSRMTEGERLRNLARQPPSISGRGAEKVANQTHITHRQQTPPARRNDEGNDPATATPSSSASGSFSSGTFSPMSSQTTEDEAEEIEEALAVMQEKTRRTGDSISSITSQCENLTLQERDGQGTLGQPVSPSTRTLRSATNGRNRDSRPRPGSPSELFH